MFKGDFLMNPFVEDYKGLNNGQISQYHTVGQRLHEAASTRWLDPEEIRELLVYGVRYGFPLFDARHCPPSCLPQSGSLYLVQPKVASQFRKDGGNWKRRSPSGVSGSTGEATAVGRVREDHVRLRQVGRPTVAGQYVHGEGSNATLKRREYSFHQMKESLHLFHYLDMMNQAEKVEGEVRQLKELLTFSAIYCQPPPCPIEIEFPAIYNPSPKNKKMQTKRTAKSRPISAKSNERFSSLQNAMSSPVQTAAPVPSIPIPMETKASIEQDLVAQKTENFGQFPLINDNVNCADQDFMLGETWAQEHMDIDFDSMIELISNEGASLPADLAKASNQFQPSFNPGSSLPFEQHTEGGVPIPSNFNVVSDGYTNDSLPQPVPALRHFPPPKTQSADVSVKNEASVPDLQLQVETNKMKQLEERIAQLEAQNKVLKELPIDKPRAMHQVIDFSPTSSPASGGTKVLIVLDSPLQSADSETLFCLFGPKSVPANRISSTVLRVCTPVFVPGPVQLQIMASDGTILAHPSMPFTFTESDPPMKFDGAPSETCTLPNESAAVRKRASMMEPPSSHSPILSVNRPSRWQPDRESKIRIIEKINTFESAVRRDARSESPLSRKFSEEELLDDVALAAKPNEELEELLYKLVIRVVGQLVEFAATDAGLEEELNQSDATGYSLLHYCCLYDMGPLVPVLLARGAAVNQPASGACQSAPLHLAAQTGNLALVQSLVTYGADPCLKDAQGCTPADRAYAFCQWPVGDWLADKECRLSDRERAYSSPMHGGNTDDVATQATVGTDTLLQNALSSLSLHDKCALSLSLSNMKNEESDTNEDPEHDMDSGSVISEKDQESLDVAISMMGPEERARLEEEACIIQHNIRAWVIRRNYKSLREATKTLQTHWRERQKHKAREQEVASQGRTRHAQDLGLHSESEISAANTLQAATRRMLANRRQLAQIKQHTLASLVIQKNLKHWLRRNTFRK